MKNFAPHSAFLLTLTLLASAGELPAQQLQGNDYYTLQTNRIHLHKNSTSVAIEKEVTFPDGVKLQTNGVLVLKNGQEKTLAAGQRLTTDGYLLGANGQLLRLEDHITLKNGKVMLVKNGQSQEITRIATLGDGTQVNLDGTVHRPDGKRFRLLDGQMLRLEGGILSNKDHVMLRGGKVLLQKDGAMMTLAPGRTMAMSDGTKVMADGTMVRPDGSRLKLQEGQRLDLPGATGPRPR